MRRFSQRSHLVTLSEINITPLLDLAFVLLIIFIITTPLLEQGLELKLPDGGRTDRQMNPNDFRTLDIGFGRDIGTYTLQGRTVKDSIQLGQLLDREKKANPNVIIRIRADKSAQYQDVFKVVDMCAARGLGMSWRSEVPNL